METSAANPKTWRFGAFELNERTGELRRSGMLVRLQGQPAEVLLYLLKRAGEMVTREELRKHLWPSDTFVDFDHSLNTAVMKLRDALRDSCAKPLYIETVARKGYRFIAPLAVAEGSLEIPAGNVTITATDRSAIAPQEQRPPSAASAQDGGFAIESVAVLPFLNAAGDPDTEYLSDGITESLINNLSKLQALRVTGRTTAFRYKGQEIDFSKVGNELSVKFLVTGRVAQRGDILQVQAEFVRTEDGSQLWGEKYKRQAADIFAVEDEIASEIASALQLRLSGDEHRQLGQHYTEDQAAYQLYLKGRYLASQRSESGLNRALELFERAIEADPRYALPWTGKALSYCHMGTHEMLPSSEAAALARKSAEHALSLDPTVGEGHACLGVVASRFEWNWVDADKEFREAIRLSPRLFSARCYYANHLCTVGRFDDALTEYEAAMELDPDAALTYTNLAMRALMLGCYEEAAKHVRKALDLGAAPGPVFLAAVLAFERLGKLSEAIALLESARSRAELIPGALGMLGWAYGISGRTKEARGVLTVLKARIDAGRAAELGLAYALFGQRKNEAGFRWVEKALEARRWPLGNAMRLLPRIVVEGPDPRIDGLLWRMGLNSAGLNEPVWIAS